MDITGICAEIRNYFAPVGQKSDNSFIHTGEYTISGNTVTPLDFIADGQYFRIVGSGVNDGVYCNTAEGLVDLTDETFNGAIWAMSVPRSFLKLCGEIEKFNAKVDEMCLAEKGYASESFGGYSYSLSSGAPAGMIAWEKRINQRLNAYRRINIL